MEKYRDEKNNRVMEKINDITVDLPMFVRRFANEYLITKNKAPRTVLGYVGDMNTWKNRREFPLCRLRSRHWDRSLRMIFRTISCI